jgi:hypothetical protein
MADTGAKQRSYRPKSYASCITETGQWAAGAEKPVPTPRCEVNELTFVEYADIHSSGGNWGPPHDSTCNQPALSRSI